MRLFLPLILGMALAITPPGDAASDIPIGFANPLSGPFALTGERNRIAVEMALRDLNDEGGVLGQKVTLIAADDGCGMKRAITAARKLVEARVRVVVGHLCSHSSLLAAGIYEATDVLMITPFSTHPRLTEEGRRNVFRLIGRDDSQGEFAGDFLAERFADKRIAILHDGSTYGEGLAREAREQLRARGKTELIYGLYTPAATSYADVVWRLRQARTEVLYVGGYGPDAGRILRTARERGDGFQLIGGDGLAMEAFWSMAGKFGERTIFSGRPDVSSRPDAAAILERLGRRGVRSGIGGLGAYAGVQVWAQAVERAGSVELGAVSKMLRRSRFQTVLGWVAFDDKGDLQDAAWQWKIWTGGDYIPLATFATQ